MGNEKIMLLLLVIVSTGLSWPLNLLDIRCTWPSYNGLCSKGTRQQESFASLCLHRLVKRKAKIKKDRKRTKQKLVAKGQGKGNSASNLWQPLWDFPWIWRWRAVTDLWMPCLLSSRGWHDAKTFERNARGGWNFPRQRFWCRHFLVMLWLSWTVLACGHEAPRKNWEKSVFPDAPCSSFFAKLVMTARGFYSLVYVCICEFVQAYARTRDGFYYQDSKDHGSKDFRSSLYDPKHV